MVSDWRGAEPIETGMGKGHKDCLLKMKSSYFRAGKGMEA